MGKKSPKRPARQRPPMESMMSYGSGNTPTGMHMGPTGSFQLSQDPRKQFNSPKNDGTSHTQGADLRQQMSSGPHGGGGRNLFSRKKKREAEGGRKSRSVLARRRGSR